MHQEVWEIRKRLLDIEHPDTLDSHENLAKAGEFQEHDDEADAMEREVVDIQERMPIANNLGTPLTAMDEGNPNDLELRDNSTVLRESTESSCDAFQLKPEHRSGTERVACMSYESIWVCVHGEK